MAPAYAWADPAPPPQPPAPAKPAPSTPTPTKGAGKRPRPDLPAGADTLPQIDHLIVLMMENHSFDNYFGTLSHGDGLTMTSSGPTNTNLGPDGRPVRSYHFPSTRQASADSPQSWRQSHQQWANGRNDGFARGAIGPDAMGYWTADDIPFYASLARTFTLCDRWFSSALGPTHPNRRFLIAGTAGGLTHNRSAFCLDPPPASGTIFERLDDHQITWRNYYITAPTAGLYMRSVRRPAESLLPISRYFADAAAGSLPAFSLVDPDFQHGSEEMPQDISAGEAFASRVIRAAMASPSWPKTLLVWCYDEHGGYYDHVPPPAAPVPDPTAPELGPGDPRADYSRYGFRVPAVVVSPYSRPGEVSHQVYDHTSVLAFLERKWNLPALTERDAHAADLVDCLDLTRAAFLQPPSLAAPKNPVASPPAPAGPSGAHILPATQSRSAADLPLPGAHGPGGTFVNYPTGLTVPGHSQGSAHQRDVKPAATDQPGSAVAASQASASPIRPGHASVAGSISEPFAVNGAHVARSSAAPNPAAGLIWPPLAGVAGRSGGPIAGAIGATGIGMVLATWRSRSRRRTALAAAVEQYGPIPDCPPPGQTMTVAGDDPGVPMR